MRYARLVYTALAVFVASLCIPEIAYAAPVDLFESQNEIMGYVTTEDLYTDVSSMPVTTNTFWQYVSGYSENGTVDGSSDGSISQNGYSFTNAAHSLTMPNLTISLSSGDRTVTNFKLVPNGTGTSGFYNGSSATSVYFHPNSSGTYKMSADQAGSSGTPIIKTTFPTLNGSMTLGGEVTTGTVTGGSISVPKQTYTVPKVTSTTASDFDAQLTSYGVYEPYSLRWDLNGFTSSAQPVYLCYALAVGSRDDGGSILSKGNLIKPVTSSKPVRVDNTYTYRTAYQNRFFGYWGGQLQQLTPRADGVIELPHDTSQFYIVTRVNNWTINSGSRYIYVNKPQLYLYTDYGLDKLSGEISDDIEGQTDTLMSTNGADGIVGNVQSTGETIRAKLGFINQTAEITQGFFEALTYEGDGTVTFPQLAWEGVVIIPETDVPILGWLPGIEDDVKTAVTVVLFLAWLHGMHSLYARIFLGQVETVSEDE